MRGRSLEVGCSAQETGLESPQWQILRRFLVRCPAVYYSNTGGNAKVEECLFDRGVVKPVCEMKLYGDASGFLHHDAHKIAGLPNDFEKDGFLGTV